MASKFAWVATFVFREAIPQIEKNPYLSNTYDHAKSGTPIAKGVGVLTRNAAMTNFARFASIACISFISLVGNGCTVDTEDQFYDYGANGLGETGDFDEQEPADEDQDLACGNGEVDEGEECDEGADNADNAACTASCQINTCGDGLVFEGVEECDMGALNGANSSCNLDCEAT